MVPTHPGTFSKVVESPFQGLKSSGKLECSGNLMSRSWNFLKFAPFKLDKFSLHFVCVQLKNYGMLFTYNYYKWNGYIGKFTVTVFLKCSVINICCVSMNLYVVRLQKQSGKISWGPGKVLEFRVSNIMGTVYYIIIKSKIHIANSYLKTKTNRLIC